MIFLLLRIVFVHEVNGMRRYVAMRIKIELNEEIHSTGSRS